MVGCFGRDIISLGSLEASFAFEVELMDEEERDTELVYESTIAESVLDKVADDLQTAGLAKADAEEDLLQMDQECEGSPVSTP
ncbi:hypothetical protein LTR67_009394 [Exophiala xenobiotica]